MAKFTRNKNKKKLVNGGDVKDPFYNPNELPNQNSGNYSDTNGNTYNGATSYNGNPISTNQKSSPYKSSNIGGYSGAAIAGVAGAANNYQQFNTPNTYNIDKAQGVINTQNSVQGAVPVWGQVQAAGKMIEAPIKNKLDKSNPEASFLGQNLIDPANAIAYGAAGIWTPKQYKQSLEDKKNGELAQQQAQQDAYNTQQTNSQNQQNQFIQDAITKGLANQNKPKDTTSYDGNPQYGKMFEMGGGLNKGTSYKGFEHDDQDSRNINEGIPLGNKNIVEKGEYRPSKNSKNSALKDYIFSDKLFI